LRRIALLASLPILTTNTSFLGPSSPSITLLKRVQCLAAASSSTPAQILIRWSRRSLASFATCLPSSRLNVLRRSKTFAPKSSTPDRLNTVVFGVFAAVALAIALVGVAGVLAFSVSARTREFGVRLAIGAQPRQLLTSVIAEGAVMAAAGIVVGAACGYVLVRLARSSVEGVQMPGSLPVVASVVVLLAAAVVASVLPAARAARVDVTEALRSE